VVSVCGPNTVEVQGDRVDELVPDINFIYLGVDAELCVDCASLFRHIVSIADSPNNPNAKILTTNFATFAQTFSSDLYDSSGANTEIEPVFECDHSRRNLAVDETRRSLIGEFPENCDEWLLVNQLTGQCLFTKCFVGVDGNPADCFECGRDCPRDVTTAVVVKAG
jgi:hypothetical protein